MIVIEIWIKRESLTIIHFLSHVKKLRKKSWKRVVEQLRGNVVLYVDLNGQSTIWGEKEEVNGDV